MNENLLRALSERRCAVLAGEAYPQVCHQILEGGENSGSSELPPMKESSWLKSKISDAASSGSSHAFKADHILLEPAMDASSALSMASVAARFMNMMRTSRMERTSLSRSIPPLYCMMETRVSRYRICGSRQRRCRFVV